MLRQWSKVKRLCDPQAVGWYPSSGNDFKPVLISKCACVEKCHGRVPQGYREPDIWILSDADRFYGPLVNRDIPNAIPKWVKGFVYLDDGRTKIEFEKCVRVFENSFFLRLRVNCHVAGRFEANLLFLNEDNARVGELISAARLNVSHAARLRFGTDDGGLLANREQLQLRWVFGDVGGLQDFEDCGGEFPMGEQGNNVKVRLWRRM